MRYLTFYFPNGRKMQLVLPETVTDKEWELFDRYVATTKEIYAYEKEKRAEKQAENKALVPAETAVSPLPAHRYWLTEDEKNFIRQRIDELGTPLSNDEITELATHWGRSPHAVQSFVDSEITIDVGDGE